MIPSGWLMWKKNKGKKKKRRRRRRTRQGVMNPSSSEGLQAQYLAIDSPCQPNSPTEALINNVGCHLGCILKVSEKILSESIEQPKWPWVDSSDSDSEPISNNFDQVDPAPDEHPGARRPWLDYRGYINSDLMRLYGTKQLTQRANITCFRCGEQGHYRAECLSWKTKLCFHYPRPHGCREGDSCSYAHNEDELRSPWQFKCVRVVKRKGEIYSLGCHSNKHTFRMCPHIQCVICQSSQHWACDDEF
jgi:hypothetical protein